MMGGADQPAAMPATWVLLAACEVAGANGCAKVCPPCLRRDEPVTSPPRPDQGDDGGSPPRYPARPDPTDAAAEVWALVERAQAGDDGAAEVARLTGLAQSTVRVHLSRANRSVAAPPRQPQPHPTPRRRYIATDFSGTDVSPTSLMRLPKGQRDVVRRFLDGASRGQIADELRISETTVRSQLSKAMRTLRTEDR
jgi:DNA-binding CsgD family transcriptional regulator